MGHHPIGIGLIGAGRHGIRYARHIVQDVPGARLAAVCRQHPEQLLAFPGTESVMMYGEPAALIHDPSVQVVIVVTPPVLSRDICLESLRAGKPVLVEKPLSVSAIDAKTMVDAARKAGVPLMTGQTLRFDATIQALRDKRALMGQAQRLLLTSHIETKITKLDHAAGYGHRGALLEIGIHLLDLVRFLTGEEVGDVECRMDAVPPAAPEVSVAAQLRTRSGIDCIIDVQRVTAGRRGTAVWIGSEGQMTADWIERRLQLTYGNQAETWTVAPSRTVLSTLTAFLQAVGQNEKMPITGEDGFRAVEIAEACYRSAGTGGRPVTLPLT